MAKSKVAQAKEELMWQKFGPMCGNCKHFRSEKGVHKTPYGDYIKELKKKCIVGPFATGKSCWCTSHEFKN
ncbi:hypothetical protein ACOHYD_13905 [Desulfobacterota bacterium M19]